MKGFNWRHNFPTIYKLHVNIFDVVEDGMRLPLSMKPQIFSELGIDELVKESKFKLKCIHYHPYQRLQLVQECPTLDVG